MPIVHHHLVETPTQLGEAIRALPRLRLCGTDSSILHELAPLAPDIAMVSTRPMRRILRFEPDDLTCSVEPGLDLDELRRELEPTGLELPVVGRGTIGGAFALDWFGPMAPSAASPRNSLLGVRGILASGETFKGGAQVVKNVAGYDLPKLFVGSRGRLFAAIELHLRLRPRPPAVVHASRVALTLPEALLLYDGLRQVAPPPRRLLLWNELDYAPGNWSVEVEFGGHDVTLASLIEEHDLAPIPSPRPLPAWQHAIDCRPSELPHQLQRLAVDQPVLVTGVGRVFSPQPLPQQPRAAAVLDLEAKIRSAFDPQDKLQ